jgi:polyvinyl alcohol dehydrogenase (cytochrome)
VKTSLRFIAVVAGCLLSALQEFDTVNNVPAHGGAIATSGAVVAGSMVFVGSGYAISSAASGGNVLLAFGVE